MIEWNITVLNQTGARWLPGEVVDFVLFQTELDPSSCNNCSSIWKIAEVGYPGKIGPIRLPSKVEFCVIDESYGNIRQSGPIPVTFGETISIVQKKPDDAPTVTLIYEEAPRGKNNVINEGGNAKPIFVIRVPSKPLIVFLSQKPFYSQPTELLLLVIWCLLVLISLFLFTSGDAIN